MEQNNWGGETEHALSLSVDSEGNVYASGNVLNFINTPPVHFDTDTIMDEGTAEPSPNNKAAFIIKYNSEGEFQWLRQPEGQEIPLGKYGGLVKTVLEPNGHSHSLVWFGKGVHLNGQLIIEGEENERIYKAVIVNYDEDGNLMDFIPLNMKPEFPKLYKYQLASDPNLDRYYIGDTYRDYPDPDNPLSINGYGVGSGTDKAFYLAAINNQGEVLWYRENHKIGSWRLGDLVLDDTGNIYFTGWISADHGADNFAGHVFDPEGTGSGAQDPFLVKLDPEGNLLWGTNPDLYSPFPGQSIVIRDNEVYLGLGSLQNTWGDVDIPSAPQGAGLTPDIEIIRFNAQTGEPQGVIQNTEPHTPTQDAIMAMALDHNGDLITGGYFGSDLFSGTDLHLHDNAQDSDFFIAKYHLQELSVKDQAPQSVKVYPNPTTGLLTLKSQNGLKSYKLFDLQGRMVKKGGLPNNQINLSGLENGLYILRVENGTGNVQNIKVVKQ